MTRNDNKEIHILDDIDAVFLDCDGTIAETERDLTLVQFNEAFKVTKGLSHIQWDYETYGELLKVGVSQYRFQAYFEQHNCYPDYVTDKKAFCQHMKELKDEMFESVWYTQKIPARPGIIQLIDEAIQRNIQLAVCSNSNLIPVTLICNTLFGDKRMKKITVYGGDMKNLKKKPAPDMYLSAAAQHHAAFTGDHVPVSPATIEGSLDRNSNLDQPITASVSHKSSQQLPQQQERQTMIDPSRCLVIEDSEVGLIAAKAAGMKCIITPSYYTMNEDFSQADIVVETIEELLLRR